MVTRRLPLFYLAALAVMAASSICAEVLVAADQVKADARMSGVWELSPELNSLLGFEDDDQRSDLVDHPFSFSLTIDEVLAESHSEAAKSTFPQFCEQVFAPMGHQVVATGQWKTKFRSDPGIETDCYISQSCGKSYLWVGAPFAVLYGGRVSFIGGATEKRDVLVLDFCFDHDNQTPNTAAYRRRAK